MRVSPLTIDDQVLWLVPWIAYRPVEAIRRDRSIFYDGGPSRFVGLRPYVRASAETLAHFLGYRMRLEFDGSEVMAGAALDHNRIVCVKMQYHVKNNAICSMY